MDFGYLFLGMMENYENTLQSQKEYNRNYPLLRNRQPGGAAGRDQWSSGSQCGAYAFLHIRMEKKMQKLGERRCNFVRRRETSCRRGSAGDRFPGYAEGNRKIYFFMDAKNWNGWNFRIR